MVFSIQKRIQKIQNSNARTKKGFTARALLESRKAKGIVFYHSIGYYSIFDAQTTSVGTQIQNSANEAQ